MYAAAPEPAVPLRRQRFEPVVALAVACGGALGAATRVGIGAGTAHAADWPVGTFVSNLIGCFVLGLLWARSQSRPGPPTETSVALRVGAMSGFCGGLTTFSSFVMDALVWPGSLGGAALWIVASVVTGIIAFVGGRGAGQRRTRWVRP